MASQISPEEMAQYKATARARAEAERRYAAEREQRADTLARQAAQLLRREYGVRRVVLFGSLTRPGSFNRWSDVDLAAWGLTSSNWLRAIGAVRALSDEIELNLVDVETCAPELVATIEREGIEL